MSAVAQTHAPQAYTATVVNGFLGAPVTMIVTRDGSKAMIEQTTADGNHLRTYYDLAQHFTSTLDLTHPDAGCGRSRFGGDDWGDPFLQSAALMQDVGKSNPKVTGSETLNGFATKVMEADIAGGGKAKIWQDSQYGLIVKATVGAQVILEVKEVKVGKPPAAVLALPAACNNAPPPPPGEAERIPAETGHSGEYLSATATAPSPNPCTVVFRVVQAGSMQPVAGFQLAIDTTVDQNHMPSYSTGVSTAGHFTFSGGGIHEVTGEVRGGLYRLDNAPANFYVDAAFGNGGDASALIHRACTGTQAVLLLVVKNPAKLGDGADWLWVKSGKFAQ